MSRKRQIRRLDKRLAFLERLCLAQERRLQVAECKLGASAWMRRSETRQPARTNI